MSPSYLVNSTKPNKSLQGAARRSADIKEDISVDPDGEFQTARLIHVRTGDQTADIFTKALTGLIFVTHRSRSLGTDRKTSTGVARDNMKRQRQR